MKEYGLVTELTRLPYWELNSKAISSRNEKANRLE